MAKGRWKEAGRDGGKGRMPKKLAAHLARGQAGRWCKGGRLLLPPWPAGDGTEVMLSAPVPQEERQHTPGVEPEHIIKLLHMENYSGRLGVCQHMKIIILLQADGELTGNCTAPGAACSSWGQEAEAFIFLGGRGYWGASPPGQGKVRAQPAHAILFLCCKK